MICFLLSFIYPCDITMSKLVGTTKVLGKIADPTAKAQVAYGMASGLVRGLMILVAIILIGVGISKADTYSIGSTLSLLFVGVALGLVGTGYIYKIMPK